MRAIALIALVLMGMAAAGVAARPSGAAAGRRRLSGIETSAQAPARNMTKRGILDCMFEDLENLGTGLGCMHGRYCGKGCSGKVDGEEFKASPKDELDRACFFHDKCFRGLTDTTCENCWCNAALGSAAGQLWEDGTAAENCGCDAFQATCSNAVREAGSVLVFANTLTSGDCASDCSAPTGDQCGAAVVYETDLYGGDYKDVRVSDWHECCLLCGSESDCKAWTYTDGGCYLKSGSDWSMESREGLISGYWS